MGRKVEERMGMLMRKGTSSELGIDDQGVIDIRGGVQVL